MSDNERQLLIRQAQEGNIVAFEKLIRQYDAQVLSLAHSMVNNREDAKDIYQEVFVRVFRGLKKFKFESEFSTWLYRITLNYAINFRKRRARYQRLTASLEEVVDRGEGMVDSTQKPGEEVVRSELRERLDEVLETLSPRQSSVFILRYYHDHKLKEIAEIMDCNVGTVKNYLFRATQKVQQRMQDYLAD